MGTATKRVGLPASNLPAPGVVVRPAGPDDDAAKLVFDAAPQECTAIAGSPERAGAAIAKLWRMPGHSASFEHGFLWPAFTLADVAIVGGAAIAGATLI